MKIKKSVSLEPRVVELCETMGQGNCSKGINTLVKNWESRQSFYEFVGDIMSPGYMGFDIDNPEDAVKVLKFITREIQKVELGER